MEGHLQKDEDGVWLDKIIVKPNVDLVGLYSIHWKAQDGSISGRRLLVFEGIGVLNRRRARSNTNGDDLNTIGVQSNENKFASLSV